MAKKKKYVFDDRTLTFSEKKNTIKDKLKNISFSAGFGLVFGAVFVLIFFSFIDSPNEKILKRKLHSYEIQYKHLERRVNLLSEIIEDIEKRDDDVYRLIFMTEPLSREKRLGSHSRDMNYAELFAGSRSEEIIKTTKKIDELTNRVYAQSKSIDEVFNIAKNKKERSLCIPAILPIPKKKFRLSSGFGYRFHPILQIRRMHTGIDMTAPTGTPVYATANGRVIEADRSAGYGNAVVIDHGYGFKTLYGHLSRFSVRKGKDVKRGDIIGYVGSTGLSQAPHLHYEVHQYNKQVNPIYFFFDDLSPEEYEEVLELARQENQSLS